MATAVQICSNALMLLGDDPIASLSEDTPRARFCANLYPIARADILRSHPWNCLVTRVLLTPRTDTPPFGNWSAWFDKPGGFLRVLSVGDDDCPEDYSFESNRFLANTSSLKLKFLEDKTEGLWDANLTNLMVKRMELDLCYPITKSTSLRDSLKSEYHAKGVGVLARAKSVDGQENPPDTFGDSPMIQVRG
jgi:hypothetical protein